MYGTSSSELLFRPLVARRKGRFFEFLVAHVENIAADRHIACLPSFSCGS